MARVSVKLPSKLKRVEIIRSEELIDKEIEAYLPNEEDLELDDELFEEPEEEPVEEIIEEEPEPAPRLLQFTEHFAITNANQPVQVSFDKIPPESMLLDDVKQEVQHAYDRGFDDAQQITTNTFETQILQYQKEIKNFDSIIGNLKESYARNMENIEQSLVALSTMMAEHILGYEIEKDNNIVLEQVRKSFAALDDEEVFQIRLHPDSVEILNQVRLILDSDSSKLNDVKIVKDSAVDKGGCVIETSAGNIDARIKTQLEILKAKLSEMPVSSVSDIEENKSPEMEETISEEIDKEAEEISEDIPEAGLKTDEIPEHDSGENDND